VRRIQIDELSFHLGDRQHPPAASTPTVTALLFPSPEEGTLREPPERAVTS